MIYLHTGLPGAGKTLFTLWHVRQIADKENRPVFYYNIPQVSIPGWIELSEEEVLKWYELPPNSIIIIDECQRIFRPRSNGSAVPKHVEELETNRHRGVDLYMITQHPGLIDVNVRKLVNSHRHIHRAFGAKFAVVHFWQGCKDNCDKSRKDSIKSRFSYPKEAFSWYKSAEAHTVKRHIPGKVFFLLAAPILVGFFGYQAYTGLTVDNVAAQQRVVANALGVDTLGVDTVEPMPTRSAMSSPAPVAAASPVLTASSYLESYTPRIPGLPHTAPRYDQITQPVRAPYPAACMVMSENCQCYSQDATPLDVPAPLCQQIVEGGFFVDWDAQGGAGGAEYSATHAPIGASLAIMPAS